MDVISYKLCVTHTHALGPYLLGKIWTSNCKKLLWHFLVFLRSRQVCVCVYFFDSELKRLFAPCHISYLYFKLCTVCFQKIYFYRMSYIQLMQGCKTLLDYYTCKINKKFMFCVSKIDKKFIWKALCCERHILEPCRKIKLSTRRWSKSNWTISSNKICQIA